MKKVFFTALILLCNHVFAQKFDPNKIIDPFIGLHCIGESFSKLTKQSSTYNEFLLMNPESKKVLKYRGVGNLSYVPLEGSWSFQESEISGLGVMAISERDGKFFSFKLNRLTGNFDEKFLHEKDGQILIDDQSKGVCKKVSKFPKPII